MERCPMNKLTALRTTRLTITTTNLSLTTTLATNTEATSSTVTNRDLGTPTSTQATTRATTRMTKAMLSIKVQLHRASRAIRRKSIKTRAGRTSLGVALTPSKIMLR